MPLELRGVEKSFGGVRALRGVDFDVAAGRDRGSARRQRRRQVDADEDRGGRALPDAGTVSINGRTPQSPADAIRLGVSLVRQELIQAEDLDVGSNVLLGHEPHRYGIIDRAALYRRAARAAGPGGRRTSIRTRRCGRCRPGRSSGRRSRARCRSTPRCCCSTSRPRRCPRPTRRACSSCSRPAQEGHRHGLHLASAARGPEDHRPRRLPARRRSGWRSLPTTRPRCDKLVELLAGATDGRRRRRRRGHATEVRAVGARARVVRPARRRDPRPGGAGRRRAHQRAARAVRRSCPCELDVKITCAGKSSRIRPAVDAMNAGFGLVPEERGSQGSDPGHAGRAQHGAALAAPFPPRGRDAPSRGLTSNASASARGGPASGCRAATSRRSCSASGWRAARRCSCSTSRRAASTSAPSATCTTWCASWPRQGKGIIVSSSEAEEIARPVPPGHRAGARVNRKGSWARGSSRTPTS